MTPTDRPAPGPTLDLPLAVTAALWLAADPAAPASGGSDAPARAALAAAALASGMPTPLEQVLDGAGDPGALPGLLADLAPLREVGALLPAPGDPMGVPRAVPLPEDAEHGVLVLRHGAAGDAVRTLALVPHVDEFGTAWEPGLLVRWVPTVLDGPVPLGVDGISPARREVHHALDAAIGVLERLDVARTAPDLADALNDLTLADLHPAALPPTLPARTADLVASAARLLAIVALASRDEGGSVTVTETAARRAALSPVTRAARRALAAASAGAPGA